MSSPIAADPTPADAPKDTILSIQVMRGIAAVAVAIYHTHLILAQPQYGGIEIFGTLAAPGWLGVNFFFVLSGFIILHAHSKDIGRPERLPLYLWKRFTRVYPIYWVLLTVFIAAAMLGLGNSQFERSFLNLLSSYLLVELTPSFSLPLQVAWTLVCEIRFYALFALLILNRRLGLIAFGLWIAGIAAANIWSDPQPLGIFHVWNVYFLCGMATYALYQFVPARFGLPLLAAGLFGLFSCVATGLVAERIAETGRGELLALALPFSLILLGGALAQRHKRWRPARILLLIGEASYSIYLVHSAAITLAAILARKFLAGALPAPLLFVAIAIFSVIVGGLVHMLIERPVLRAMRWKSSRHSPSGSRLHTAAAEQ